MRVLNITAIVFCLSVFAHAQEPTPTVIDLEVTEKGFVPNKIDVVTDKPVELKITRKTDNTCSTSVQIPSLKLKKDLPLNKTVTIPLGKLTKGEIRFGCGMNMMDSGIIYVK
ncbi:cupredoxin domain-containing protein [bacterium]|nr:cupredoxin domain-containing protein [bacterium]